MFGRNCCGQLNPVTAQTIKPKYKYNNEEKVINISVEKLDVENAEEKEKAVNEVISGLTDAEKNSANGADRAILFGEASISKAATLKTDSDKIVFYDGSMSELADKAKKAEGKITNSLSSVKKIRSYSTNSRIAN